MALLKPFVVVNYVVGVDCLVDNPPCLIEDVPH